MPITLDAVRNHPEQLLELPEDQWFDRKRIAVAARDVGRTLVAFANAEGGVLALGASPQERLGGVRANTRHVNDLRQAALNFTDPPVRHTVQVVPCQNRRGDEDELLLLEGEPSERMHRMTNGSVWLRVGDEDRELDHDQALQLSYDKGISHFDNELVPDATLEDLDLAAVERYREALDSRLSQAGVLAGRGSYRERGLATGLTWAGLLLFRRQPARFYPNAYVRLIQYEGVQPQTGTRMNVLRDDFIEGSIPTVVEQTKEALPNFLTTFTRLGASGRFERVAQYPEAAWLEAVVNALTHRSYGLHGDHIRVRVFDDRLEVESPGRLPGLVRPDNIRTTRYSRNPRIARVLAELGYVRELGEGVDRMFDEMAAADLPPPVFRQEAASLVVTLFNNRLERQRQRVAGLVPSDLVPLVDALLDRGRVTTSEAAGLLDVSRQTASRYLSRLQALGVAERVGSGPRDPTAYWRLRAAESGNRG